MKTMKLMTLVLAFTISTSAYAASESCMDLMNNLKKLSFSLGVLQGQLTTSVLLQPVVSIDLSQNRESAKQSILDNGKYLDIAEAAMIEHCLK
jgi:hypothetical protein